VLTERWGLSPSSQQPANGPYPEPGEPTPPPSQPVSLKTILNPSSHLRLGLPSGAFLLELNQNLVHVSPLSHACHMPCPPHSPWFDLPNDIWGCFSHTCFVQIVFSPLHIFQVCILTVPASSLSTLLCCLHWTRGCMYHVVCRVYHLNRNAATVAYCATKMKSEAGQLPCHKLSHHPLWHWSQGHPGY
jgi:hypothetical protein